ncbi:putative UPF0481 protein At3g02645 [Momordica charantia]|uniref:UPF0481 protein At3g02645 n=1 Tax=Momordica charantia TaxID=3673 RepID=A0A6J1DRQ6_MOMCH|nr:putative UPF0481 protein At3g02645 [Momordica charantia]
MALPSDSILSTNLEWVVKINELLQRNDFHTAFETPISIFQVPDCIRNDSPEAFTPRRISLGPYHHSQPQLLKLELLKLDTAKKVKDHINLPEFHQLVSDKLNPLELKIRACFGKYFELGCESLSWIMLIDSLFLIRLLHIFAEVEVKCYDKRHELPLPELDAEHQQMYLNPKASLVARNEIVGDTLMLENQVPFCVLKEILSGTQIINDLPALVRPSSFEDSFPMIPSASKLKKVGVEFRATYNFQYITFDKEEASLWLPAITLDSTSHVILRNLVAFEVGAKFNPPSFSKYAAIMNGLIATTNDVNILKEARIIINNLESDEEAVELFNGFMKFASKSESSDTESSSKPGDMVNMVEIIEEVNKYYESKWKIRVTKFVKKYVSPMVKIFSILVVVSLIIFVIVRTLCGLLFSCPRILKP